MTVLLIAVIGLVTSAQPSSPPQDPRFVCLDVSGSMGEDDGGETRLTRSVRAIRDLIAARPPRPDASVILVTFNHEVHGVRIFTDAASLEGHLKTLAAGGGTKISLGLEAAAAEVERRLSAHSLELILISDFQDNTFDDDREAEILRRFNRLLRSRAERGLSNTVFVRLWDTNEPARVKRTEGLMRPLVADGAAVGIDLASWERVPVRVETRATVVATDWESPGNLRVKLQVDGKPVGNRKPLGSDLEMRPDRGSRSIPLHLDGRPSTGDVLVDVTADEINRGSVTVALAPPPGPICEPFPGGEHDIAIEPIPALAIPLPKIAWTLDLQAMATSATWIHLATDRASLEVEVRWQLVGGVVLRPLSLSVAEAGGASVSGRINVDRPSGSAVLTVSDRMTAGAKSDLELIFTPDPDPLQPVRVEPVKLSATAPAPVAVAVEEVVPAGARRLGSRSRGVVEGAAAARKSRVEVTFQAMMQADLPKELVRDLMFEVHADHTKTSASLVHPGQPVTLELVFPRRAGLWSYDRLDSAIRFEPVGGPTSVRASPATVRIVREPIGIVILVVLLGVATVAAIGWTVVRGLGNREQARG